MSETEPGEAHMWIRCAVCLQPFQDPRTLPCGHSFCRDCLDKCALNLIAAANYTRPAEEQAEEKAREQGSASSPGVEAASAIAATVTGTVSETSAPSPSPSDEPKSEEASGAVTSAEPPQKPGFLNRKSFLPSSLLLLRNRNQEKPEKQQASPLVKESPADGNADESEKKDETPSKTNEPEMQKENQIASKDNRPSFPCPLCRQITLMSIDDIPNLPKFSGFSTDYDTANQKGNHSSFVSETCSTADCGNPPSIECMDGCGFLCDSCLGFHSRMKSTTSHNVVNIIERREGKVEEKSIRLDCIKHVGAHAEFYCKSCGLGPFCIRCVLSGHRMHDIISIEEGLRIFRRELTSNTQEIQSIMREVDEQINMLQLHTEKLEDSADEVVEQINKKATDFISKIEKMRDIAIERARSIQTAETKQIELELEDMLDIRKHLHHSLALGTDFQQNYSDNFHSERLLYANTYLSGSISRYRQHKPYNQTLLSFIGAGHLNLTSQDATTTKEIGFVHLKKGLVNKSQPIIRPISDINAMRFKVGRKGTGPLEFDHAWGIGVHPHNGNIYVADQFNHRIQILSPDLQFVAEFGRRGSNPGQFNNPISVAVSPDGEFIVVTDNGNHRLQIFTTDGIYLNAAGSEGQGEGHFKNPINVAVNRETGQLYAADTRNERVQIFTRDGEYVKSFGQRGSGDAEVGTAEAVAITENGQVCVLARGGNKILVFDLAGNYLNRIPIDAVSGRTSMISSPGNLLWISDSDNHQIVVYNTDGEKVKVIGSSGSGDGQFTSQMGLAFGPEGNFYVCDYGNNRIQVF